MKISKSNRLQKSIDGTDLVENVIGQIEEDTRIFAITRGQISMIDAIKHTIKSVSRFGLPHVSVWTWCVADYEIECFESLVNHNGISGATLVIDRAGSRRNRELMDKWQKRFGTESVRLCMNHAKIATVSNQKLRVAIRGSMNLNYNPRFENLDISVNDGAFDLINEIESGLDLYDLNCTHSGCMEQTGVSKSFSQEQLAIFNKGEGLKIWRK